MRKQCNVEICEGIIDEPENRKEEGGRRRNPSGGIDELGRGGRHQQRVLVYSIPNGEFTILPSTFLPLVSMYFHLES